MKNSKLYKRITHDNNIYLAIYKLNSYIFEKELLSNSDIKLFNSLQDKFNKPLINAVILKVRGVIDEILLEDELFKVESFLRPKKLGPNKKVIFRPLHTIDLFSQIAMVAMFNGLIYDDIDGHIKLNELSKLVPCNFYGNVLSDKANELYVPWQLQYSKYSKDVTGAYNKYFHNGEYNCEINLDIKEFFPSINPGLVYQLVLNRMAFKYQGEEKTCFETVLFKLVYFKLGKIDNYYDEYYGKKTNVESAKGFCKGIPQGLPISYFWGNIVMAEAVKVFANHFPGKAYYYVDDSLIYTKEIEDIKSFKDKIKRINKEMDALCKKQIDSIEYPDTIRFVDQIKEFQAHHSYNIHVHSTDKSGFTIIDMEKTGQLSLNILSKLASTGAKELLNTFNDSDDITLLNKFNAILVSIGQERKRIHRLIKKHKDRKESYSYYLKMLNRFYKFFEFRIMLLEDKKELNIPADRVDKIISILENQEDNKLEHYFTECEEGIFSSQLVYVARSIINPDTYNKLEKAVANFDLDVFFKTKTTNNISYFAKVLQAIKFKGKLPHKENIAYHSLIPYIKKELTRLKILTDTTRIQLLENILNQLPLKTKEPLIIFLDEKSTSFELDLTEGIPCELVMQLTDEISRVTLNALISIVLNIEVDNYATPHKTSNSPITYLELRLVTYIRNKNFKLDLFIEFLSKLDYSTLTIIDYSIFQVLDYYRTYVKYPERVDGLIQVHKYTVDMWKHGSKFLHFYTLHNQEHAIELIKAAHKFNISIDYFQISSLDYYILFISCYLHDISMVIYPRIMDVFKSKNNHKSNLIFSNFKTDLDKGQLNPKLVQDHVLRDLLIVYYNKIDAFFENHVRVTHANDSGKHITTTNDLQFITPEIKDIVAEVTKAHGHTPNDIYGVRSVARDSLVSRKYLKIFLRMCDLLDMSEERVTDTILQNNIEHMSCVTQFHWLSHSVITGYEIETKYINNKEDIPLLEHKSYLSQRSIEETIIFKIRLNIKHWENMPVGKCSNHFLVANDKKKNKLLLEIKKHTAEGKLGEQKSICEAECNFICKWMSIKNEYFYEELYELQKYLTRSGQVNYFNTTIKVEIQMEDEKELNSNHYDIINRYIDSKD